MGNWKIWKAGTMELEDRNEIEEVINVQTPLWDWTLLWCNKGDVCGDVLYCNCSQVSVHKIPETACLTGSSECHDNRSNTCLKLMNDRMAGM